MNNSFLRSIMSIERLPYENMTPTINEAVSQSTLYKAQTKYSKPFMR
jgi:hypothetical protein